MLSEPDDQLVRFLKARADRTLRSAWMYDANEWEALYVREDIGTEALKETIESLIQNARDHEPIIPPTEYGKMGNVVATAELHRDAVLLHFQQGESEGMIVTLDDKAAQNLVGFVESCNEILSER